MLIERNTYTGYILRTNIYVFLKCFRSQNESGLGGIVGKFSSYTILYVDDEQWIMEGLVKLLELEFKVLTTSSADAALALIETQEHSIDLILLDIMMSQGRNVVDSERGRTSGWLLQTYFHRRKLIFQ